LRRRERKARRPADPTGAAGDEGDLAAEVVGRVHGRTITFSDSRASIAR
jgi:hypothetical protein